MSKYEKGDRVAWRYIHHFNKHSYGLRMKLGTFSHYCKESGAKNGIVAVQFDGNKTISRVPVSELYSLDDLA